MSDFCTSLPCLGCDKVLVHAQGFPTRNPPVLETLAARCRFYVVLYMPLALPQLKHRLHRTLPVSCLESIYFILFEGGPLKARHQCVAIWTTFAIYATNPTLSASVKLSWIALCPMLAPEMICHLCCHNTEDDKVWHLHIELRITNANCAIASRPSCKLQQS